ncbi:hypothetical protein Droror1_Dr00020199 [Drosera rotundifolia]
MDTNHGGEATMWAIGAYPPTEIGGIHFGLPEKEGMLSLDASLSSSCPDQIFHWEPISVSALSDSGGSLCGQARTLGTGYQPAAMQHWDEPLESQRNYPPINSTSLTLDCNWVTRDLITTVKSTESVKLGKYSAEERRDRILRYLTKRNHRNFNKTIKYACRKTLADRRIRVRGRFAKNHTEEVVTMINSSSSDEAKVFYPYDCSEQMKHDSDDWLQEAMASLFNLPCNTPANQLS